MNTQTHIVQHNAITTARYEYNETQLNLFFFLLSKVRADNKDGVYSITLNELSKMTGREHQPAHIKSTLEEMVGRYFHIEKPDGWMLLLVFQSIQYINGEGRIIMKLTEDVRPYLHDLKANFTKFQLYSALRLRSKHAKRIYTLCSQWKSKGETPRYDLLTFKEMLGLYDSQTGEEKLKVINSFETRVLKEAVSQINELTDLRIAYEMKKEGRAFKWLWFTIKTQELAVPTALDQPQTVEQGPVQGNFLDDLIQKIESRQDCPLNGSELRTALSALLSWGASADLLNTFANNYEYLKRAKQYAYSVRMMDEKPVAPLAELIAELNI